MPYYYAEIETFNSLKPFGVNFFLETNYNLDSPELKAEILRLAKLHYWRRNPRFVLSVKKYERP